MSAAAGLNLGMQGKGYKDKKWGYSRQYTNQETTYNYPQQWTNNLDFLTDMLKRSASKAVPTPISDKFFRSYLARTQDAIAKTNSAGINRLQDTSSRLGIGKITGAVRNMEIGNREGIQKTTNQLYDLASQNQQKREAAKQMAQQGLAQWMNTVASHPESIRTHGNFYNKYRAYTTGGQYGGDVGYGMGGRPAQGSADTSMQMQDTSGYMENDEGQQYPYTQSQPYYQQEETAAA